MPNWCVGNLKIRGESVDITHFLTECIEGCECDIDELGTVRKSKTLEGKQSKGPDVFFATTQMKSLRDMSWRMGISLSYQSQLHGY